MLERLKRLFVKKPPTVSEPEPPPHNENVHQRTLALWESISDKDLMAFCGSYSSATVVLPACDELIQLLDQTRALLKLKRELSADLYPVKEQTFNRFNFFVDIDGNYIDGRHYIVILRQAVIRVCQDLLDKERYEFGLYNHNRRQTAVFVLELYKLGTHFHSLSTNG